MVTSWCPLAAAGDGTASPVHGLIHCDQQRFLEGYAMRIPLMAALLAVGLTATAGLSAARAGDLQENDLRFLREAASGGLAEVALGKLAVDQGHNPDVRAFGKRMMDDHGKGNEQLMTLAADKKVELPSELPTDAKQAGERLAAFSGAAFDREFMKDMVTDHEKVVAAFEQEAASGGDSDVKQFAAQALPMLRDHLTQARRIQAALKGVSSM
jgi:putative membrane protein